MQKVLSKIISCFLIFTLVLVALVGCGKSTDKTNNDVISTNDQSEQSEDVANDDINEGKLEKELSSNTKQDKGIVKFWGGTYPEECGTYDLFKEETGYTIENKVPECSSEKLLSALASGAPPDVVFVGMGDVVQLAAKNALRPIDDFIKQDDNIAIEDFYPFCIKLGEFDGKHYAFPWDIDYSLLYWDKDMFEEAGLDPDEPPTTWEDMLEYAKLLTKYDSKGEIEQIGFKGPNEFRWYLDTMIISNQGSLYSEDGRHSALDSKEVLETFDFIFSLTDLYGGEQKLPKEEDKKFSLIDHGNVAMTISDSMWHSGPAYDDNRNIGFSVPPAPEGKELVTGGWATWALVLPEKSVNPQGGYEFAKWMATTGNRDNSIAGYEADPDNWAGTLLPHIQYNKELNELAAQNCKNERRLNQHQIQVEVFEKYVKSLPKSVISTDINEKFEDMWKKLNKGEITKQDAVKQLDKDINNLLDDYHKDK